MNILPCKVDDFGRLDEAEAHTEQSQKPVSEPVLKVAPRPKRDRSRDGPESKINFRFLGLLLFFRSWCYFDLLGSESVPISSFGDFSTFICSSRNESSAFTDQQFVKLDRFLRMQFSSKQS